MGAAASNSGSGAVEDAHEGDPSDSWRNSKRSQLSGAESGRLLRLKKYKRARDVAVPDTQPGPNTASIGGQPRHGSVASTPVLETLQASPPPSSCAGSAEVAAVFEAAKLPVKNLRVRISMDSPRVPQSQKQVKRSGNVSEQQPQQLNASASCTVQLAPRASSKPRAQGHNSQKSASGASLFKPSASQSAKQQRRQLPRASADTAAGQVAKHDGRRHKALCCMRADESPNPAAAATNRPSRQHSAAEAKLQQPSGQPVNIKLPLAVKIDAVTCFAANATVSAVAAVRFPPKAARCRAASSGSGDTSMDATVQASVCSSHVTDAASRLSAMSMSDGSPAAGKPSSARAAMEGSDASVTAAAGMDFGEQQRPAERQEECSTPPAQLLLQLPFPAVADPKLSTPHAQSRSSPLLPPRSSSRKRLDHSLSPPRRVACTTHPLDGTPRSLIRQPRYVASGRSGSNWPSSGGLRTSSGDSSWLLPRLRAAAKAADFSDDGESDWSQHEVRQPRANRRLTYASGSDSDDDDFWNGLAARGARRSGGCRKSRKVSADHMETASLAYSRAMVAAQRPIFDLSNPEEAVMAQNAALYLELLQ